MVDPNKYVRIRFKGNLSDKKGLTVGYAVRIKDVWHTPVQFDDSEGVDIIKTELLEPDPTHTAFTPYQPPNPPPRFSHTFNVHDRVRWTAQYPTETAQYPTITDSGTVTGPTIQAGGEFLTPVMWDGTFAVMWCRVQHLCLECEKGIAANPAPPKNMCTVCGAEMFVGPGMTPGSTQSNRCPFLDFGWHKEAAKTVSKHSPLLHVAFRMGGFNKPAWTRMGGFNKPAWACSEWGHHEHDWHYCVTCRAALGL